MITSPADNQADFLIIGGGIAGTSIGYWLARHGRVLLLEREAQPGYHSTGRSAALFAETYGTRQVRVLTMASRSFFDAPPEGFADRPLLSPRGALIVATIGQDELLRAEWQALSTASNQVQLLPPEMACAMVPALRPEKILGAIYDPGAADVDVHALHQGYLRGLRQHGGVVVCEADVTALRQTGSGWLLCARGRQYAAPIVVNAAGAWADKVARLAGVLPIGLTPKRRSAFMFSAPEALDTKRWPLTTGIAEDWYFKPDAGMLLGSPANADPVEPHDVQPEELDIATGIFHIEEMSTLRIRRPTRTWAGLRSFVADGDLVGGFDPVTPGFFWLAAQGGYGIQTSPAMGETCAALVRGKPIPPHISDFGLSLEMLSPARLKPSEDNRRSNQ